MHKYGSKWDIVGVFWTCALKKWGKVFSRVGIMVNLYFVPKITTSLVKNLLRVVFIGR